MTKREKIAALDTAMTRKTRPDGEEIYVFADDAPKELQDLFCERYEVRDVDYGAFSSALDAVSEIYSYAPDSDRDAALDALDDAREYASPYNAARLAYINIYNQDEVAEIVREYGQDVVTAAAIWYDRHVEAAARLIVEWVEAD